MDPLQKLVTAKQCELYIQRQTFNHMTRTRQQTKKQKALESTVCADQGTKDVLFCCGAETCCLPVAALSFVQSLRETKEQGPLKLCAHDGACLDGMQITLRFSAAFLPELAGALCESPIVSLNMHVVEQTLAFLGANKTMTAAFATAVEAACQSSDASARLGGFACRLREKTQRWWSVSADEAQSLFAAEMVPFAVRCEFLATTVAPAQILRLPVPEPLSDAVMSRLEPFLKPDQVVLAGGAAMQLLPEAHWVAELPSSNKDVFILPSAAPGTLTAIAATFQDAGYQLWKTHSAILTAVGPWPLPAVQLISSPCQTTAALLLDFDFEVVRVAFDGSCLHVGTGVHHGLLTRRLNHDVCCCIKPVRFAKMVCKGFAIDAETQTFLQHTLGWPLPNSKRREITNWQLFHHAMLPMDTYFSKLGFSQTWSESELRGTWTVNGTGNSAADGQPSVDFSPPSLWDFQPENKHQALLEPDSLAPKSDDCVLDVGFLTCLFSFEDDTSIQGKFALLGSDAKLKFEAITRHLHSGFTWDDYDHHEVLLCCYKNMTAFFRNGLQVDAKQALAASHNSDAIFRATGRLQSFWTCRGEALSRACMKIIVRRLYWQERSF